MKPSPSLQIKDDRLYKGKADYMPILFIVAMTSSLIGPSLSPFANLCKAATLNEKNRKSHLKENEKEHCS